MPSHEGGLLVNVIKSNLLLLLTAAIWGLAFVAQRVGMDHLGPLLLTGYGLCWAACRYCQFCLFFKIKPNPWLKD